MNIDPILPTLITLAVNVPVTLLTTFLFNERLKNHRVRKDLLIENIKELLGLIQGEQQEITTMLSVNQVINKVKAENRKDLLEAQLSKKSEMFAGLLSSQARIQALFDLVQIQSESFPKLKQAKAIGELIEKLKNQYSDSWQQSIDIVNGINSDQEFIEAYTRIKPEFRRIFRELITIIDVVNVA